MNKGNFWQSTPSGSADQRTQKGERAESTSVDDTSTFESATNGCGGGGGRERRIRR